MRKFLLITAVATSALYFAPGKALAQVTDTTKKAAPAPAVQSESPTPTEDVTTVLMGDSDYSSFAAAFKGAAIDSSLKSGGPYTIFAPNNAAFNKLPAGKLDSLKSDKVKFKAFLKDHIVTGRYSKADIIKALNEGKGKATLNTIGGQSLALAVSPNQTLQLTNAAGNTAEVVLYDLIGTNGVVNGINEVLLP